MSQKETSPMRHNETKFKSEEEIIIYYFTYKDYIQCIHHIKQNHYFNLQEDEEEYNIWMKNSLEMKYKVILEYLLKDKKRICLFLNNFLGHYEKIEEEQLICIEFYRGKNGMEIIYKNIDKQVFYIIIYQEEISRNLPYFILQECIKTIKNAKEKHIKNIIIIPIVIYTRENMYRYRKTVKKYFQMTTYDNHILELKYNLINLFQISNMQKMKNTLLEEMAYVEEIKEN